MRKHLTISEVTIEEDEVEEEEEGVVLPKINPEMEKVINSALASRGEVRPLPL